jgi:hypothetical protein
MKWTRCLPGPAMILVLLAVAMIATGEVANAGHHKATVVSAPAVCAPAAPTLPPAVCAPAVPAPPPAVCAPATPPPPVCGPAEKGHVKHTLFKHHKQETVYYTVAPQPAPATVAPVPATEPAAPAPAAPAPAAPAPAK